MAEIHGLDIVKRGLVLNLDAGNPQSYDGNAVGIRDLISGNMSQFSNGPYFTSTNKGTIIFDGINDYIDFSAPGLTTTATVEMWMKLGSSYSNKMPFGWLRYDVYCLGGAIGYNTGNSDCFGITQAQVISLGLQNNWAHYIFEMRSDVVYTANKIYINGQNQTLSQITSSESASDRNFNSGNGRISGWKAGSYQIPMQMASFRVYNRQLDQTEITQNFNANRNRFAI